MENNLPAWLKVSQGNTISSESYRLKLADCRTHTNRVKAFLDTPQCAFTSGIAWESPQCTVHVGATMQRQSDLTVFYKCTCQSHKAAQIRRNSHNGSDGMTGDWVPLWHSVWRPKELVGDTTSLSCPTQERPVYCRGVVTYGVFAPEEHPGHVVGLWRYIGWTRVGRYRRRHQVVVVAWKKKITFTTCQALHQHISFLVRILF